MPSSPSSKKIVRMTRPIQPLALFLKEDSVDLDSRALNAKRWKPTEPPGFHGTNSRRMGSTEEGHGTEQPAPRPIRKPSGNDVSLEIEPQSLELRKLMNPPSLTLGNVRTDGRPIPPDPTGALFARITL